jgi:hypothetical protein
MSEFLTDLSADTVPDEERLAERGAVGDLDGSSTGSRRGSRSQRPESGSGPRSWKLAVGVLAVTGVLAAAGLWAHATFGGDERASSVLVDDFETATSEGVPGTGLPWKSVLGEFGASGGRAVRAEPNPDGPRSIVAADVGATNYVLRATAGQLTDGWGIAFRFVGPFNHWYLQAVPEFSIFNVMRVADGTAQRVGATAVTQLRDGMVVEVRVAGSEIQVSADGRMIFRTVDDHGLGATAIGLLTATAAEGASWDRIEVDVDEANPGRIGVVLRPPLDEDTTRKEPLDATDDPDAARDDGGGTPEPRSDPVPPAVDG